MNKNIFITGAASGIGKATAIFFAKKGWNVGLFDINEKGLVDVANEIGHNSCMYKKLDVTNLEEWTDAINAYSDYTNGTCDLFFNNAGIAALTGRIEDIPIEEAHKIVEINLNGVINGIFKILPLLKKYLLFIFFRKLLKPNLFTSVSFDFNFFNLNIFFIAFEYLFVELIYE